MDEQKNLRVIFTGEAEPVFTDIIKSYGLQETDEEFDEYLDNDKESREMVLRDAVIALAKKLIPEDKLKELLQKHLAVPSDIVDKILQDIKNKLLPLLLVYPEEKFNDPTFRNEISQKAFGEEKKSDIFSAQEMILEKIRSGAPQSQIIENQPKSLEQNTTQINQEKSGMVPNQEVKKVEVQNVEENANKLKEQREETAKPGTAGEELQNKGQTDKYREQI